MVASWADPTADRTEMRKVELWVASWVARWVYHWVGRLAASWVNLWAVSSVAWWVAQKVELRAALLGFHLAVHSAGTSDCPKVE